MFSSDSKHDIMLMFKDKKSRGNSAQKSLMYCEIITYSNICIMVL